VVFRRDRFERFEKQRSALRARLRVEEAPVDDGWGVWVRLREALLADEVVVLQGDRVMPGQKGEAVPFLGGHLLLPAGPVKLALATGAPIVPIFSLRTAAGKVRLFIEPAIEVGPAAAGPHPALLCWATLLEKYVRDYPDQWLMLQPVLIEDAGADAGDGRHGPTQS
jgi:KDO2-lipid IV(A) lauroyltransferase